MGGFIRAELYYLKKDAMFKNLTLIIILLGIVLAIFLGNLDNFLFETLLYPLNTVKTLSVFLFFIFPIYFCLFSTEGFETGSIKVIIASSVSKKQYVVTKILISALIIVLWSLLFVFFYMASYIIGALLMNQLQISSAFFNINLSELLSWIMIDFILLACSLMVVAFGFILKKIAPTAIATFFLLFGDFMFNGYFKDSHNSVIQLIATNTFSANIMKLSGNYLVNNTLFGSDNYLTVFLISFVFIIVSITIALTKFVNSDIN